MTAETTALEQRLSLELFEGPLDLLLTLILREEVDLLELPVAEVATAALGEGELSWDADTAGELIVLLAATAELKARVMLGEQIDEEPDPDTLEARERLAARLIAYAPFQRAGEWLGERSGEGLKHHYRRAPIEDAVAPVRSGDLGALARVMTRMLIAPPQPALGHLTHRRVSLPEVLTRLRDALATAKRVSFERMVGDSGPLEEGMTLVALLELARRGEAQLEQPEPFGDIAIVSARPSAPPQTR
ncbi:MAG: segregation/condensation protein A [Thermoleophilia bacterium]|nr:segregation/condensation protein A [Thermoleophilia bacterium]